jgi:hypothetical protein
MIMAATAIATLASPVMAQPQSHRHAAAASVSSGHGSIAGARTPGVTPVIKGNSFHIDDADHVAFPVDGGY